MNSNMQLTINNMPNSGADNSQVYICILGNDPSNDPAHPQNDQFGYLDFKTGQAIFSLKTDPTGDPKKNWKLDPATMVTTLDNIKFPLEIPNMNSARIYISVYDNFAPFPASGPTASMSNKILFDKIEFDSGPNPNINGTCVDFYGLSYVISGYDNEKGKVSCGFEKSRTEIINALNSFRTSPEKQQSGNTGIFKKTFVPNDSNEILRVLAPKAMALTDWGKTEEEFIYWANRCSHFFDDYLKNQCFRGGRKFKFYSKKYNKEKNSTVYYGTTPPEGGTIHLWTDEACTIPYKVPRLNMPAAPWPLPDFKPAPLKTALYHNVGEGMNNPMKAQNDIDWGFLLLGNSTGEGAAAHWGDDELCMAIMVSICRGVMHYDDGTVKWVDPELYYKEHDNIPIFYYSSILHKNGRDGKAYVLSYDDVYGENPSIFFKDHPEITVDLYGLDKVKMEN